MSLNLERIGLPIAVISENNEEEPTRAIYFDDSENTKARTHFDEIDANEDEKFAYVPNVKLERSICYVAGMSGSGKSYWSKEYIKRYLKLYPQNPIYLFSATMQDESLDKELGNVIKRIKIYEPEFLDSDLKYTDFENSLVMMDDIDTISDKKLRKVLDAIQNDILRIGRHSHTSLIILSHLLYDRSRTALVLNESHSITIFLRGINQKALKYFLDTYMGYDKVQIKKLKKLKGRSITIIKSCPNVILGEKQVYIANDTDCENTKPITKAK